jgi:4a-hydroxytetrahydrobiopterin dehydratase
MSLADRECVPCKGGVPPLTREEIAPLREQLLGWAVVDDHHLHREYPFKDFVEAVSFVNALTPVAEEQGHHPDLTVSWGKVGVDLWTHTIDGLTESDFVIAAKFDRVRETMPRT